MACVEENPGCDAVSRKAEMCARKAWSCPVVILASAGETAVKGTAVGDYTLSGTIRGS